MMKRWFLGELQAVLPALLLWVGIGTTAAWGQVNAPVTPDAPNSAASIERNGEPSTPATAAPTSDPKSQVHAWFNQSGSGLLLSLTPFATGVTLLIVFLLVLIPLLIRASTRRKGYFRAVPYTRQRRFS